MNYEEFREEAIRKNLCGEYTYLLNKKNSNKQLYDILCHPKGLDYMFDAIAKGWGMSDDVLLDMLKPFINGKVTADYDKFSSKLYCSYSGEILADTTLLGIINSDCIIDIPNNMICEIYLTGKCNVSLIGEGECVCVCYGNYEDIVIDKHNRRMKRLNKTEADIYE